VPEFRPASTIYRKVGPKARRIRRTLIGRPMGEQNSVEQNRTRTAPCNNTAFTQNTENTSELHKRKTRTAATVEPFATEFRPASTIYRKVEPKRDANGALSLVGQWESRILTNKTRTRTAPGNNRRDHAQELLETFGSRSNETHPISTKVKLGLTFVRHNILTHLLN
jgi:hypothetical protein